MRNTALTAAFMIVSCIAAGAHASPTYTAAPLEFATNNDLLNRYVSAFNNQGAYTQRLIVAPPPPDLFLLSHAAIVTDDPGGGAMLTPIAPLGNDLTVRATGLNDGGDVVGVSFVDNSQPNTSQRDAFFRAAGGSPIELPRIDHGGWAEAINNSRVIVGHSFTDPAGNQQVAARSGSLMARGDGRFRIWGRSGWLVRERLM